MAKIYESQGPRARLRGPQTTPGFQPVQAVDASRQTLAAGQEAVQDYARVRKLQEESALDSRRIQEQQVLDARRVSEDSALSVRKFQLEEFARVGQTALENSSKDLEALSQFSNSLNKFLFDRAQAQNEKDMKLEMAKVLNGDLTVQPNVKEEFNTLKDRLADAALSESNLSDFIANNISNVVAEEHRAASPALKGWRAYGNALGRVKKAAAMAQNLLTEFMESAEQTVPIPNEDGTQRVIAPRDAKTPSELMAALAVGEQMFISSAQLNTINPILISEHLTPQIMAIRESIVSNRTAAARKSAQLDSIEKVHERIGADVNLLDPENPAQIQQFWQETTKDLQINGRMGRGEANKAVIESFITHADALGRPDLLTALAATPLIADQPNGPTVGDRFRPLFEQAARSIESYEDAMRAKAEKAQDDMVDDLLSAHQLLLTTQGVTPDQISTSWSTTTDQLRQLAAQGSRRAINELSTLIQQGENYNPFLASDLARDIASGRMPNPAELDELVRIGRITVTEANDLKNRLPSSAAVEKAKAIRPEIQRLVRGIYADILAQQGINATDAGSATALLEGQMTDELEELAQAWAAQNPNGSPAEIRDFLRQRADALGKQPRFTPEIIDGVVRPKAGLSQNSGVVRFLNPVTGNQTRDFTRANPAQVQTSRPVTRADFLINSQELAQNTQAFIQGGQPTPRVRALMTATGKDWQTFLRDQSKAYGIPFTNLSQSQAAQAASQRRQLAPAAAAILTNPNATAQQRVRAWNDINSARQRSSQRQQAVSGEAAGKTEGVGGLLSLIRSGEGGWTSVNRGVAGDTPGGMPNLTSMSIGEIERLQDRNQVFAVGAYQFTPGVLARARREAGLSPNEPFTPQNQNLMGVALLTGTKRPRLAAYLRGESDDLRAAHQEISMEWAALQGPNGRGYYDGDKAGNRASISAQQVQQMLIQARQAISGR
jgi:hypothetical protein